MNVGVLKGVAVAGVTMAVCVWKKAAAKVPTLWVKISLTSRASEVGACPAQEPNRVAVNSMHNNVFRALFIFTSV